MFLNEAEQKCQSTAFYLTQVEEPTIYAHIALKGKIGELGNVLKKMMRNDGTNYRSKVVEELGDIWWYFLNILVSSGTTLWKVICFGFDGEPFQPVDDNPTTEDLDFFFGMGTTMLQFNLHRLRTDYNELHCMSYQLDVFQSATGVRLSDAHDFFMSLVKVHRRLNIPMTECLEVIFKKIEERGKTYYVGTGQPQAAETSEVRYVDFS